MKWSLINTAKGMPKAVNTRGNTIKRNRKQSVVSFG